jgi:hypothetical protein
MVQQHEREQPGDLGLTCQRGEVAGEAPPTASSYLVFCDRGTSPRAEVLQYHHTYLRMRTDIPDLRFSRDGEIGVADGSILSYLRAGPRMTLV